MAQEKESLVESHWSDFQPPSSSAMIYRREVIPRQRALSALLIGLGIIVTLILLLVLSYFMHIYSSDHSHINMHDSLNPICLLPRLTGKCHAKLHRWGWNSQKTICEEFIYGGCDANENNFLTKEECETICKITVYI
ncbi:unnamed protein product [Schistosoma margrebowiei]|uniref:BPTI/Kunitz inhibitor domain-containing protein n=1 Tax=Schistosoma margrebowiei TaxID=48269 RepID=A0AA84ZZU4_9TREM|nr:unnamed protein product [Schistosoma margrebowiei]